MGWKKVKEHYRIEHTVQVDGGNIWIGSAYIPKLIVIGGDGEFRKPLNYGEMNSDLNRYQREMLADMGKLRELVKSPDEFAASIVVYTYDGGRIIEKFCEKTGWPNVTHDGEMMYENTFSTDRETVVKWAIENAEAGIRLATERLEEQRQKLTETESLLVNRRADLELLKPSAHSAPQTAHSSAHSAGCA